MMYTGDEIFVVLIVALVLIGIVGFACTRHDDSEPTTDLDDKAGIWKGDNEL